ncbi:cell division protein ZapB [Micromonospora maritima]|uniref:cell division protein ZapB n=1 Tax=Micromonospora maritima TaxID=986711 RepID=UPI00157C7F2C|nr:cell division protein ZapB [Micromonospora maritima]
MTATHVDGRAVIMDVPMRARVNNRGTGEPLYLVQSRELLVEAGNGRPEETYYGCLHCTYTSLNPMSIRPHLGNCKVKKAKEQDAKDRATKGRGAGRSGGATLADVVADTQRPVIREVTQGHWAEAAKRGSAPAAVSAKKSLMPTITVEGILRRLEELQGENEKLRAESRQLKARTAKLEGQLTDVRNERNVYLGEINRFRKMLGQEPLKAGAALN